MHWRRVFGGGRRPDRMRPGGFEHYRRWPATGTLIAWATVLGHKGAVALLQANLDQEKHADALLTKLWLWLAERGGREGRVTIDEDHGHAPVVSPSNNGINSCSCTARELLHPVSVTKPDARFGMFLLSNSFAERPESFDRPLQYWVQSFHVESAGIRDMLQDIAMEEFSHPGLVGKLISQHTSKMDQTSVYDAPRSSK